MAVKPEHIINLKGKSYVFFAGLLEAAHEQGLKGVETSIMTELSNPAEQSWVVQAIARFRTEGEDALFWAHGDASPQSSQMRGAFLRHAETRAVARALRLATGTGMTAFEELGPDTEEAANGRETAKPVQRARHDPQDHAEQQQAPPPLCSEPGCGEVLSPSLVALCRRRASTLEGRLLCAVHLEAFAIEYKARQAEASNA